MFCGTEKPLSLSWLISLTVSRGLGKHPQSFVIVNLEPTFLFFFFFFVLFHSSMKSKNKLPLFFPPLLFGEQPLPLRESRTSSAQASPGEQCGSLKTGEVLSVSGEILPFCFAGDELCDQLVFHWPEERLSRTLSLSLGHTWPF